MEEEMKHTEPRIRWRKIGGGSFRMASGRIIKPNEVFLAFEREIPEAFRDVVIPEEPLPDAAERVIPAEEATPKYELRSKGPGWYDVVNVATGEPINERSLRRDEAEKMVESLS
jgi:hypothetical protein